MLKMHPRELAKSCSLDISLLGPLDLTAQEPPLEPSGFPWSRNSGVNTWPCMGLPGPCSRRGPGPGQCWSSSLRNVFSLSRKSPLGLSLSGHLWGERASPAAPGPGVRQSSLPAPRGKFCHGVSLCQHRQGGTQGRESARAAGSPSETPITRLGNTPACLSQTWNPVEPGRVEGWSRGEGNSDPEGTESSGSPSWRYGSEYGSVGWGRARKGNEPQDRRWKNKNNLLRGLGGESEH